MLYNVPLTEKDWNIWSLSHAESHRRIISAASRKGKGLTQYQLDPINFSDVVNFLNRNQQAHIDMNIVAGTKSPDLQSVDFQQQNQLAAWIALHARNHRDVEYALGV